MEQRPLAAPDPTRGSRLPATAYPNRDAPPRCPPIPTAVTPEAVLARESMAAGVATMVAVRSGVRDARTPVTPVQNGAAEAKAITAATSTECHCARCQRRHRGNCHHRSSHKSHGGLPLRLMITI